MQTVLVNSPIISANPSDPSYVNLAELDQFTDQDDKNLLSSTDQRWNALVQGSNSRGEQGTVVADATDGSGLIVYNGFDTDFVKAQPTDAWRCAGTIGYVCPSTGGPTVDWLGQMWYSELNLGAAGATSLPASPPVVSVGTPVAAPAAGLPTTQPRACKARTSLLLRLRRLGHLHGRKIVQVDVYLNRRHVLRETPALHQPHLATPASNGHLHRDRRRNHQASLPPRRQAPLPRVLTGCPPGGAPGGRPRPVRVAVAAGPRRLGRTRRLGRLRRRPVAPAPRPRRS